MNKYWIITFGCQMNKSDSERIAGYLESKGYRPALKEERADLIVVNMCSVRQSAVNRIFGSSQKFSRLKTKNKKLKIVLTGCILEKDRQKLKGNFDEIWTKNNYTEEFEPKRKNNSLAYIPISNGCNNFCSYCVVPYTRGPLACRNHEKILEEIKKALERSANEIWLLGQNVNDYKSSTDPKINFAKLIKMVNKIPGDFKFFFISPHPKNFSEELINALAQCKKFGKRLNLPVQSGDNRILKKMNRPYTAVQYKNLVKKIRKKIPDIFLSTDIIVGFPGETEKQFQNTAKLFREINFNMAYISKYSPRPGTAASKIKDNVSSEKKKERRKKLNDILSRNKIVVILGPTASGKSELAVKIAQKFNGEIISADSRQVYKGMDIGSGKITKKEMRGIPHHLLDVASPKRKFTVVQYCKLTLKAIDKIIKKNRGPIICGGTGFYIQAVVDGIIIPEVLPDWKLRKELEKKTTEELFKELKKLDLKRAGRIDKKNRRRLIRALEIIEKTKKPVPSLARKPLSCPVLFLGIKKSKKELSYLVAKRLEKRLKKGMVAEVKKLKKSGLSWKRLEEFGLEYRFIAQYLQKKISRDQMMALIQKESENYAKRQMTWFNHQIDDFTAQNSSKKNFGEFKRNKRIFWINNCQEAEKIIQNFLR